MRHIIILTISLFFSFILLFFICLFNFLILSLQSQNLIIFSTMLSISILASAFIIFPVLIKLFLHLIYRQPLKCEINGDRKYYPYSGRLRKEQMRSNILNIVMAVGTMILFFVSVCRISVMEDLNLCKLLIVILILLSYPFIEILIYRNCLRRFEKEEMSASEMRRYHERKASLCLPVLGINGEIRRKSRFFILSIGILLLLNLSIGIYLY